MCAAVVRPVFVAVVRLDVRVEVLAHRRCVQARIARSLRQSAVDGCKARGGGCKTRRVLASRGVVRLMQIPNSIRRPQVVCLDKY